ncbi:hypothetical protein B6D60_02285 [candidate division KSB1 bacterium 4484_87]|nr:MAG: hypothetical protein B6D60_02285 [candidate division KSB1 bacterium 4484_87]
MENEKRKILIIEDSLTMQRILSFVLEKEGYEVEIANNGAEGLDKARASKPDLIFTDLMMPVMDGFEVCRQIRADDSLKDAFVIILTGRGQDTDIEKGLQAGADDYLMKPFDPPKVVERVRQIFSAEKAAMQA